MIPRQEPSGGSGGGRDVVLKRFAVAEDLRSLPLLQRRTKHKNARLQAERRHKPGSCFQFLRQGLRRARWEALRSTCGGLPQPPRLRTRRLAWASESCLTSSGRNLRCHCS